jgi:hypothetical protein
MAESYHMLSIGIGQENYKFLQMANLDVIANRVIIIRPISSKIPTPRAH